MDRLADILARQAGVVSRRQVLEAGLDDDFLRSAVRRRLLRRVHEGVYIDHTGPLTWQQRAWAAVLFYWPAALSHESVLLLHSVRPGPLQLSSEDGPIRVLVDHDRRVVEQLGTQVRRRRGLPGLIHPSRRPPQTRLEDAVLDVAVEAKCDEDAIATLANACQSHRTTARRVLDSLRKRPKLKRRRFLLEVLEDVATGAYSLLEHKYLTRVERPHGLPTGKRQRRVSVGRTAAYRDVEYLLFRLVVELDGRLGHEEQGDRWNDMDRDVEATIAGKQTMRLGWRHVLRPCRTALAVGKMLRALGWGGELRPCSPECPVATEWGGSQGDAA